MKIIILILKLCFLIAAGTSVADENVLTAHATKLNVNVGLGVRPPFLLDRASEHFQGAGPEILQALNQVQQQFNFIPVEIPSKRKVQAIIDGKLDIIMWDNKKWGWGEHSIAVSSPLVYSKDIYFTLKKAKRTQKFFSDFSDKKIAMVIGYHYKMNDFITDIELLSKRFDVTMVRNEEASIRMVIAGRVDMAVVSETALNWYLIRFPQYQDKVLVSKRYDTQYGRHFLLPNNYPVTTNEMNEILQKANKQGLLSPIYKRYGLIKPESFL